MEAALAEQGEESPAKPGSLRWIARNMLVRAGDETAAAKEVADRLDGKAAQPVEMSGSLAVSHEEALDALDGQGTDDQAQTS